MPAPPHIQRRVRQLRRRLESDRAEALLVTNGADVSYLTGFAGDDSWLLVPLAGGRVYLLSDFRYEEQIDRECPHVAAVIRKQGFGEEVLRIVRRLKLGKVLLQRAYATLGQRRMLVKHLGASRVGDCDDGLLDQRAVKDEVELRLIRRAIDVQQRAFLETKRVLKPSMTEAQVAAHLDYRMRSLGADGPGFKTIIARGRNAALPHAFPSARQRIGRNTMVQFDWGAWRAGYRADLSRMVTLGRPARKLREIYEVVLEAQQAAIAMIRPGVALKDIDAAARRIIADAGYARRFGHGLGHGIGRDIHERPVLSPRSQEVAQPGHVITVEPGIYLPGVGGVRIEDDVVVTARGRRVLSDLPRTYESTII